MSVLFELNHVNFCYQSISGETSALSDISFKVNKGDFISIVGPSGCGKSTLLSLIAGLIKPDSGTIDFYEDLYVNNPIRPIGYMLQHDTLLEWRNVYKNCILGLEINHALNKENTDYTMKLIKDYGLDSFCEKKPSELSGGMRQRVALIRTLVLRPELLLLDEPFSALDYQTRLMVSDDICKKIRSENKTTILVTHDLSEAISLSDKVYVLSKRPAKLAAIFEIKLTKDPNDSLSSRKAPEFQDYFKKIWEALYGS